MQNYFLIGFQVIVILVAIVLATIYIIKFLKNNNINQKNNELYVVDKLDEKNKKKSKEQEKDKNKKDEHNPDK